MCMGFVHSYQTLYCLRVLLGLSEAGLVPGIVYVTSMYYRRHEYQKRLSFVFAAVPLAGAFGGVCSLSQCAAKRVFFQMTGSCVLSDLLTLLRSYLPTG